MSDDPIVAETRELRQVEEAGIPVERRPLRAPSLQRDLAAEAAAAPQARSS